MKLQQISGKKANETVIIASKIWSLCLSRLHKHYQTDLNRAYCIVVCIKGSALILKLMQVKELRNIVLQCSHSLAVVFVLWLKVSLSASYPYEVCSFGSVFEYTILKKLLLNINKHFLRYTGARSLIMLQLNRLPVIRPGPLLSSAFVFHSTWKFQ